MIEDIRADTNNIKSNSGNKKVFNNLDKLINDIRKRKCTIEKVKNIVFDLGQQRQKARTIFQNKMIDVVYYLFNSLIISSQQGRLMLPKWVKVSENIFNEILSTVTKTKNEGLKTNVDEREITLDNTENPLKDLGNETLDGHEFKNRYNNIANDAEAIVNMAPITRTQAKIVEILSLLKEILKSKKTNEQPDTTDMSELESEESVAERRNPIEGLKILTPDKMLSRLPITLAQLKAGNNSQKLINEIR